MEDFRTLDCADCFSNGCAVRQVGQHVVESAHFSCNKGVSVGKTSCKRFAAAVKSSVTLPQLSEVMTSPIYAMIAPADVFVGALAKKLQAWSQELCWQRRLAWRTRLLISKIFSQ